MEVIFEIVLYFLAELVLTVIGEAVTELGFHPFTKLSNTVSERAWRRFLLGFLYAVAGVVLGALSLKFIPLLVSGGPALSVAYFVVVPVLAGLSLCLVNWLMNYGIDDRAPFFQTKKFIYGVLFALMFALTRSTYGWAVLR